MDSNRSSSSRSSSSLFSSRIDQTVVPTNQNLELATLVPTPDVVVALRSLVQLPLSSPVSSPQHSFSPTLSSTPLPSTQSFAVRLAALRKNDDDDDDGDDRYQVLLDRNKALEAELSAMRLQYEEATAEIERLRSEQQQQQPPFAPVLSKAKKKRDKKNAAAQNTLPPGCTSLELETPPPPPPQVSSPLLSTPPPPPADLPTVHLFHDSNLRDIKPDEIQQAVKNATKQADTPNYTYSTHQTYTLPQTFAKIKQTTFKKHDIVIINTLTNDARQTKNRKACTPRQTQNTQSKIINHLKTFIQAKNIIILESPPLSSSTGSDIFPFNCSSFLLSRQLGTRFAETLVGEAHLFRDGYHILRKARHLLVKSVVAAILNVRPHQLFACRRPPYGDFGPWIAPSGQGMPLDFRGAALSRPISFRRPVISPLMNFRIRGL